MNRFSFRRAIQIFLVTLWIIALHFFAQTSFLIGAYASNSDSDSIELRTRSKGHLYPELVKAWSEIKEPGLNELVPVPEISLRPRWLSEADLPKELRTDPDYKTLIHLLALEQEGSEDKAYVQADSFIKNKNKSPISEWLYFLKADALFAVLSKKKDAKLSLVLEEYEEAIRLFPLQTQIPRALYQTGLIQLHLGYFQDVEDTVRRALKEYPEHETAPLFHLLMAEQAFLSKQWDQAYFEYSLIVSKYPRSDVAIDASFRRAVLAFDRKDYKTALQTYLELEKFHTNEFDILRMAKDSQNEDKILDRIYFAETLYLNHRYSEAAKMFQDLSNLFPNHEYAGLILLRFADSYMQRNYLPAAESLYREVLKRYSHQLTAMILAKIRLADLFVLSRDFRASKESEKLYQQAFEHSQKAKLEKMGAFALARLAGFQLATRRIPKAQATLRQYKDFYQESTNQDWVEKQYVRTIELEIVDYYKREDYLAALTTYLVLDRVQVSSFTDTRVLMTLADAAKRLNLYEQSASILNRVIYLEKDVELRQQALLKLVDLLILQKDLKRASERLRRFNFAYPLTPYRHLYEMAWGNLYDAMDQHPQAIEHYERALASTKANEAKIFEIRMIYPRLAKHYEEMLLTPRAIESYQKFVNLVDEYRKPLPRAGRTLESKDLFIQKTAKYRIADSYFDMKDYSRALEAYRVVAKDIPEEPFASHAKYRIGECYLAMNDRKAAIKSFTELAQTKSDTPWVKAAKAYTESVQMEVNYGIRIFN